MGRLVSTGVGGAGGVGGVDGVSAGGVRKRDAMKRAVVRSNARARARVIIVFVYEFRGFRSV